MTVGVGTTQEDMGRWMSRSVAMHVNVMHLKNVEPCGETAFIKHQVLDMGYMSGEGGSRAGSCQKLFFGRYIVINSVWKQAIHLKKWRENFHGLQFGTK